MMGFGPDCSVRVGHRDWHLDVRDRCMLDLFVCHCWCSLFRMDAYIYSILVRCLVVGSCGGK